jgi:integrase
MSYDKLDGQKNQIQRQLTEKQKDWILDQYLPQLKRTTVKSRGSQANYLQAIKKIFDMTETSVDLTTLDTLEESELEKVNVQIVENIQDSKYRNTKGVNSRRRKSHQWTAWKKALETQGIDSGVHQPYIPKVKFEEEDGVNHRSNTKPEDLPAPSDVKKFVDSLGNVSGNGNGLRNQALAMLLWDKGPRIGEALDIQNKHWTINGKQLKITIPGNKKSSTRTVEIFQGRKTLKDWIQTHPNKTDDEAYLFPNGNDGRSRIQTENHLRDKFKQARNNAELTFKVDGEPCHIFRKAMDTAHLVNEWATWEQVCTWKGKSPDSTKPDYVLMATEDVDAAVAEKIGISDDVDREVSSRLKEAPLLPKECGECGNVNTCFKDVCSKCGTELPESTLPKGDAFEESDRVSKNQVERIEAEFEKKLKKIKEDL